MKVRINLRGKVNMQRGEWVNITPAPEIIIDSDYNYANMSPKLIIRVANYHNYSMNIRRVTVDGKLLPPLQLNSNSTYRFMNFDTELFPKCSNDCHTLSVSVENGETTTIYSFGYLGEIRFGPNGNGGTEI